MDPRKTATILMTVLILSVIVVTSSPQADNGVQENKKYVDAKPTYWSCTTRSGSCTGGCSSASASCSGSERVISGGCYSEGGSLRGSNPSGSGWACSYSYTDSIYAYAQCCT